MHAQSSGVARMLEAGRLRGGVAVALAVATALLERDGEAVDARAFDLDDLEAHAVVGDLVAGLRGAAEEAEDEAGHRVVVLVREVGPEPLVEVVDRKRPVDPDRVLVDLLDRLVREVELVLDLADDLLEQVLERDDP